MEQKAENSLGQEPQEQLSRESIDELCRRMAKTRESIEELHREVAKTRWFPGEADLLPGVLGKPGGAEQQEKSDLGQEPQERLSQESIDVLRREVAKTRRISRKPDLMLTALVLLVLAGIGFYLYRSGAVMGNRNPELNAHVSVEGYVAYDIDGFVSQALSQLGTPQEQAAVYQAGESSQRKVALIFYGMGTPREMDGIVQALREYNMPAIFFADAVTLAENRDITETIQSSGYTVGTAGFTPVRNQEALPEEKLVTDLAKSQAVFQTMPGGVTQWYYGPGTEYTAELLQTIPCAGVRYAVRPSCYLSASSLPSFSAAAGFVGRLNPCELICVKVGAELEEEEYQPYEVDDQVEKDKQPSVTLPQQTRPEQPDIAQTVEYLVEALDALQIPVVPVSRIGIDPDPEIIVEDLLELPDSPVIVPEGKRMDSDYFDGVLMIGDSLTQILNIYGTQMRGKAVICAYKSITPDQMVNNVTTEDFNGNQVAVLDEILGQSPRAIYVMLGMNSLAGGRSDNLLTYYGRLIDLLREAYPQVPIYIESITPVTLDAAIENIQITNRRIRKTNLSLIELAEEKGCWYLDLNSALSDEEGNMIAGVHQPDGVHLKAEGCRIWMDYLLTHVAEEEPQLTAQTQ